MKKLLAIILSFALIVSAQSVVFATMPTLSVSAPTESVPISVISNGYNSIKISWSAVPDAKEYQVYRSTTGKTGSFTLKKTTTNTYYYNTGITSGKTYYYKVRSINENGKSPFSEVKSTHPRPAKIDRLYASDIVKDNTSLSWYKVKGATGYQLFKSKGDFGTWKFVKNVTSTYCTDSHKSDGSMIERGDFTKFRYKVRAYRTVKGKKIYGYFSVPVIAIPSCSFDKSVKKEYRSALLNAVTYCNNLHLSKAALYDQLTSDYGEQFSAAAADYAVKNIHADWKSNALETAKSYNKTTPMSKVRLYQQLTSEYGSQFTPEEAQYAIDHLTINWKLNAYKSAQSYYEYQHMSKDGIYQQLTSEYGEQFTPEEAQYAVDRLFG